MSKTIKPLARSAELRVQTVADETLVYDDRTDKAYVLSPSAAAVWRACNGKRSVSDIAQYLSSETRTSELVVWYALRELDDLLVEPVAQPAEIQGMSRRQFLTRTGLVAGAVAVPVVVSMVAPKPAHAQSATQICCVCNNNAFDILSDCTACNSFCVSKDGVKSCTTGLAACEF